jgi:CRP-like cAMP-binding protein
MSGLAVTSLVRSECSAETALVYLLQVQGVSRSFRGFTDEELQLLTPCFAILTYQRAEVLFEEGEPFTWAGVVLSGVVREEDADVGYRAGDCLGEPSLFTTTVCEAQLVGHEQGMIACTTLAQIAELSALKPKLALKLLKCFAEAAAFHSMGFGRSSLGEAVPASEEDFDDEDESSAAEARAALILADRNAPMLREWARAMHEQMGWLDQDVRDLAELMTVTRLEKHERLERVGHPRRELGLVLRGAVSLSSPQGELLIAPGGYFGQHTWGLAPEGLHVLVVSEEAVIARAPLADVEELLVERPALMAALLSDIVRHAYAAAQMAQIGVGMDKAIAKASAPPPVVRAVEAASQRLKTRAPTIPEPSRYDGDGVYAAVVLPGKGHSTRGMTPTSISGAAAAAAATVAQQVAERTLTHPPDMSITSMPEAWGIFLARRMARKGAGGSRVKPPRSMLSQQPQASRYAAAESGGSGTSSGSPSASSFRRKPERLPSRLDLGASADGVPGSSSPPPPPLIASSGGLASNSSTRPTTPLGGKSAPPTEMTFTDATPAPSPMPGGGGPRPFAAANSADGTLALASLQAQSELRPCIGGAAEPGADAAGARVWMSRHSKLEHKLQLAQAENERLEQKLHAATSRAAASASLADRMKADRASAVHEAVLLRVKLEHAEGLLARHGVSLMQGADDENAGGGAAGTVHPPPASTAETVNEPTDDGQSAQHALLRAQLDSQAQLLSRAETDCTERAAECVKLTDELEAAIDRARRLEDTHEDSTRACGYLTTHLRRMLIAEAAARRDTRLELKETRDALRKKGAEAETVSEKLRELRDSSEMLSRRHLVLTTRFLQLEAEADLLRPPPPPSAALIEQKQKAERAVARQLAAQTTVENLRAALPATSTPRNCSVSSDGDGAASQDGGGTATATSPSSKPGIVSHRSSSCGPMHALLASPSAEPEQLAEGGAEGIVLPPSVASDASTPRSASSPAQHGTAASVALMAHTPKPASLPLAVASLGGGPAAMWDNRDGRRRLNQAMVYSDATLMVRAALFISVSHTRKRMHAHSRVHSHTTHTYTHT